eukprot:Hpha_TRINITY_DN11432_c0_g1::TRINITY_DN11432_c0_g1_i1::g.137382::m.137382
MHQRYAVLALQQRRRTQQHASFSAPAGDHRPGALNRTHTPRHDSQSQDSHAQTPRGQTPRGQTPRGQTPRGQTPRAQTPRPHHASALNNSFPSRPSDLSHPNGIFSSSPYSDQSEVDAIRSSVGSAKGGGSSHRDSPHAVTLPQSLVLSDDMVEEEDEVEEPRVIPGRIPSLMTLWRYAGIQGAEDGHSARDTLIEMNRTFLYKEFGLVARCADINVREKALGIFGKESAVRQHCIRVVDALWFDYAVLIVIALNTIVMAMEFEGLDWVDNIFLACFTLEVVYRVLAFGFVLHRRAYLRSFSSAMDFAIVLSGYLALLLTMTGQQSTNLTPFRLLRVIRPLRAISRIPSLKLIMETIVRAAPVLQNVLMLTGFVLILFAIVGIQLWNGLHHNRCFAVLPAMAAVVMPIPEDSVCCAGDLLGGRSTYNNVTATTCELDTGQYGNVYPNSPLPAGVNYSFCSAQAIATGYQQVKQSGRIPANTTYEYFFIRNISGPCAGVCDFAKTGMIGMPAECHQDKSQYTSEILNFDDISTALLLCFKVMSLDGWPQDLEDASEYSTPWASSFFVALTLVGNYFTVNLVLAALASVFGSSRSEGQGGCFVLCERPILSLGPATLVGGVRMLCPLIVLFPQPMHPFTEDLACDDFDMESVEEEDGGNKSDADDASTLASQEQSRCASAEAFDGGVSRRLTRVAFLPPREGTAPREG